jgi:hypothetical protein
MVGGSRMTKYKQPRTRKKRGGRNGFTRDQGLQLYRPVQAPDVVRTSRMVSQQLSAPPIDSGNYLTHSLSDLPSTSDFTNLFDMWRITKVDVTFLMTATGGVYPTLYLAQDNADATPPSSLANLLERGNVDVHQFGPTRNQFTRSYKPQANASAYQGISPAYALLPTSTFISTSYPGVYYYGMKYWLAGFSSGVNNSVTLNFRYYLEFKGTK